MNYCWTIAFFYYTRENDPDFDKEDEDEISRDSPEWYQIHIATEQIKVPEIYFQPSIVGSDQAGISETLAFILDKYDRETSGNLAANVFVTGAPAKLPGLIEKLSADLQAARPFKSFSKVCLAKNPGTDAFRGMQKFASLESEDDVWITKAEYEEQGPNIFKQHCCSNKP